jgi:hypothetical protein
MDVAWTKVPSANVYYSYTNSYATEIWPLHQYFPFLIHCRWFHIILIPDVLHATLLYSWWADDMPVVVVPIP